MIRITAAINSQATCVPGLLTEVRSELLDDVTYPPGQEVLWAGLLMGAMLAHDDAFIATLPKNADGIPIISPETIKLGLFEG